jgi:hypothetical protein
MQCRTDLTTDPITEPCQVVIEGAPRLLETAGPWAEGLGLGVRE